MFCLFQNKNMTSLTVMGPDKKLTVQQPRDSIYNKLANPTSIIWEKKIGNYYFRKWPFITAQNITHCHSNNKKKKCWRLFGNGELNHLETKRKLKTDLE